MPAKSTFNIRKYCAVAGKCLLFITLWFLVSCSDDSDNPEANISKKWNSVGDHFKNVNAVYIAHISANGEILTYAKGTNTRGEKVDGNTIFEAASLSKTYFAYLYWKLLLEKKLPADSVILNYCDTSGASAFSPFALLSHTSQLINDSCALKNAKTGTFAYSEYGYLALQHHIENKLGKNLQEICEEELTMPKHFSGTSYIWKDTYSNYVNGYVKNNEFHRNIHIYDTAFANGTLYTSGNELTEFVKILLQGKILDSMQLPVVNVPRFNNLYWGRGIGVEINKDRKYCWQWGSNWSFNSLVLINKTDKTATVILTNSVIGQSAIKQTINWLLNTDMQAFQYLEWY